MADLDGDHRLDAVHGQGENPAAIEEKIFLGSGLDPDTAPPVVARVEAELKPVDGRQALRIRARVHDRKSPTMPHDWQSVTLRWAQEGSEEEIPMTWYGEYLWFAEIRSENLSGITYRVCAIDAAGNQSCSSPHSAEGT